jgi:hypothetical protein
MKKFTHVAGHGIEIYTLFMLEDKLQYSLIPCIVKGCKVFVSVFVDIGDLP